MKLSETEISEIVQLLRDADFDDLELEWDDIYLRIARRSALEESVLLQQPSKASAFVASKKRPAQPVQPGQVGQPEEDRAVRDTAIPPAGLIEVRSPLMGTVYRSPQPGDPSFVEVGTSVQPGDTLCLLEVMKVFTALKADIAGSVDRIQISDGDLVEYDQVIMWIRPA